MLLNKTVASLLLSLLIVIFSFSSLSAAELPLPRSTIEQISYKLQMENGVTYPDLAQCLEGVNTQDVGVLIWGELGAAVATQGLHQLGYNSQAQQLRDYWQQFQPLGQPALLAISQANEQLTIHACSVMNPRARVKNMTYRLRLPEGGLMYPTMDFCAKNGSFENAVLLVIADFGAEILSSGMTSLGYRTDAIQTLWHEQIEQGDTRLATLLALRDKPKADKVMSVSGFHVLQDEPVLVAGCHGDGHKPEN